MGFLYTQCIDHIVVMDLQCLAVVQCTGQLKLTAVSYTQK